MSAQDIDILSKEYEDRQDRKMVDYQMFIDDVRTETERVNGRPIQHEVPVDRPKVLELDYKKTYDRFIQWFITQDIESRGRVSASIEKAFGDVVR
jgi:hypothetical protein